MRHHGERWNTEAVLFALQYTDRITSVLTGDVTSSGRDVTQSRNLASADIFGFEFRGELILTPSVSAHMVLNYVRGDQLDADRLEVPGDRIPPLNGRLALNIQVSDSFRIEPYWFFAGSQDRLSPRDIRDPRIDPDGSPGWATVNLRGQWAIHHRLQLNVSLENVLDKHYRLHGSGIDAVGRNLHVSIRTSW